MGTIRVTSLEETAQLALELSKRLQPYSVITLEGPLGAGKTTFTQSLAKGLGIKRAVKSPSYTLVREYEEGDMPLYHIDLYRLEADDVGDLYLEDYFESPGVTVIEWGSNAPEELPNERLLIQIETFMDEPNVRQFNFIPMGETYEKLVDDLMDTK